MVSKKDKFTKDKFKLVLVEWTDAMDFDNGWHDLKKVQAAQVEQVVSVGWIVTEDDKHIVLSSDFCSDCTSGRAIAIPKDWCQKIIELSENKNGS
jgi:hypothetical protein|tara:strand:- start:2088 stop:2372 length:285 start_codon:yes stop_codon:yes gene_type:complete